jgi:hypothetical protein
MPPGGMHCGGLVLVSQVPLQHAAPHGFSAPWQQVPFVVSEPLGQQLPSLAQLPLMQHWPLHAGDDPQQFPLSSMLPVQHPVLVHVVPAPQHWSLHRGEGQQTLPSVDVGSHSEERGVIVR